MNKVSQPNLKSKVIKSFSYLLLREAGMKIFAFLGQIFLARLLLPTDFGIFAIFSFVINFFQLFTTLGFNYSIIQREKEITKKEINTSFFIQEFFSFLFVILIFIFGSNLKLFYPNLSTTNISWLKLFSLGMIITPYSNTVTAILERKLSYKKVSFVELSGVVIYEIIAVILAFQRMGVLSFIIAILVKEVFQDILLFILEPYLPTLSFDARKIRSLLNFGLFVQFQGFLTLLLNSLNPIIIGKFLNTYFVGIIDFAATIGYAPEALADNLGRVSFASFSRIQKQRKSLIRAAQISTSFIASICFFVLMIIFTSGFDLINFVFTSKWVLSIISIYFFSISMLFYSLRSPLVQIVLAMGKSKVYFSINLIGFIIQVILSLILIKHFSYNSIAIAAAISTFLTYLMYLIVLNFLDTNIGSLRLIMPKIFIFILSLIFNYGMIFYLVNITFWYKIAFDSIFYFLLYFVFCKEEFKELLSLVKNI